jgi:hypothetical protein
LRPVETVECRAWQSTNARGVVFGGAALRGGALHFCDSRRAASGKRCGPGWSVASVAGKLGKTPPPSRAEGNFLTKFGSAWLKGRQFQLFVRSLGRFDGPRLQFPSSRLCPARNSPLPVFDLPASWQGSRDGWKRLGRGCAAATAHTAGSKSQERGGVGAEASPNLPAAAGSARAPGDRGVREQATGRPGGGRSSAGWQARRTQPGRGGHNMATADVTWPRRTRRAKADTANAAGPTRPQQRRRFMLSPRWRTGNY